MILSFYYVIMTPLQLVVSGVLQSCKQFVILFTISNDPIVESHILAAILILLFKKLNFLMSK